MEPKSPSPKKLLENLYKQNIELVVKNKTLSLLGKLYEISILTLKPEDLATKIAETIQSDLDFEIVAIYSYTQDSDQLAPLSSSFSSRARTSLRKIGFKFDDQIIEKVSKKAFFKKALNPKKTNTSISLKNMWNALIGEEKTKKIELDSHIKTTLLYPLKSGKKVLGVIMLSLNHEYNTLSSFEKESIDSFVNLVGLSIEKALLYKELESANKELRETDEAKNHVINTVAHQLNGIVTKFRWFIEMFQDDSMSKEEYASQVDASNTELATITNMFLDAAHIHDGKLRMQPKSVNLNDFFKRLKEAVVMGAKEKNINYTASIPEKMPTVLLDENYTYFSIENLLSNAIKYTDKGGKVDFKVEIKNGVLFVEVKDNGRGIPEAERDKMFGQMYRASNVKDLKGNGLGLYIAKYAVTAQGGKIDFESEGVEGKGTTFFIELPLKKTENVG